MALAVASTSLGTKSTSGAVTVTKPSGTVDGDLLVAVHVVDIFGTVGSLTAPAGWTQTGTTNDSTASLRGKVWYRIASGEGASYSFGNDDTVVVIMFRITGQDTTTPINVAPNWKNGGSAQTSLIANAVTPTVNDALLICAAGSTYNSTAITNTPPSGMTEHQDSGAGAGFAFLSDATLLISGGSGVSTGTKTFTASGSGSNEYLAVSMLIAPAVTSSALLAPAMVQEQAAMIRASVY